MVGKYTTPDGRVVHVVLSKITCMIEQLHNSVGKTVIILAGGGQVVVAEAPGDVLADLAKIQK